MLLNVVMSIDVNIGTQSINMASGNFASLWAILDLPVTDEGTVLAGDLAARIRIAEVFGVEDRPQVEGGGIGTGTPRWVDCGMDADYIQHRFQSMLIALSRVPVDSEVVWY